MLQSGVRSLLNTRSHKHMCKGSAEMTYTKLVVSGSLQQCELWDELPLIQQCLTSHVGHNILCAFPKSWLAANLMSSHF